jgi:hypothetical protein
VLLYATRHENNVAARSSIDSSVKKAYVSTGHFNGRYICSE